MYELIYGACSATCRGLRFHADPFRAGILFMCVFLCAEQFQDLTMVDISTFPLWVSAASSGLLCRSLLLSFLTKLPGGRCVP